MLQLLWVSCANAELSRNSRLGEKVDSGRFALENALLSAQPHIGNRLRSRDGSYGRVLYNRFRYYDPSIGRYISADPIGQWGDVNLYRYSLGSPLRLIDPRGLYVAYEGGPGGEIHLAVEAARQEWEYLGQEDPISELEDSSGIYQIQEGTPDFDDDGSGGIIQFLPGVGLNVSPDEDERGIGGTLSDSDALHHEACHAQNRNRGRNDYNDRRDTPDNQFGDAEERKVITGPERELQRRKGGPERNSHGGRYRRLR